MKQGKLSLLKEGKKGLYTPLGRHRKGKQTEVGGNAKATKGRKATPNVDKGGKPWQGKDAELTSHPSFATPEDGGSQEVGQGVRIKSLTVGMESTELQRSR